MRSGAIPFKFDMSDTIARIQRIAANHIGDIRITLPFVSAQVNAKPREREIARELVIRLKDRRVLSAWECCDNCIDAALSSLQEIRKTLVDKQVELSDMEDGPLYVVLDAMRAGIRQFLTYEQSLRDSPKLDDAAGDFRRQQETRQAYFDALEVLRGHLSRCLGQVAAIADMDLSGEGIIPKYQGDWQVSAYYRPQLSSE